MNESAPSRAVDLAPASALFHELVELGRGHVPTQAMLDYAFGGYNDEIMERLFGHHLAVCSTCRESLEVYCAERPADPARLFEIPEFAVTGFKTETYTLSPEEAGERLRSFIDRGSGALWIVAGEANPAVYTPETGRSLEWRAERAARAGQDPPQVLCGPVMGLGRDNDNPEDAVLPQLARSGAIRLFAASHRQGFHFRASEDGRIHTEEYHRAGATGRRTGYWYRSRPIAALLRRRFEALIGFPEIARRASGIEDFMFLPMSCLAQIDQASGGQFDTLTVEDLAAYRSITG